MPAVRGRPVGALGDGNAQAVAQAVWNLVRDRHVPAADEKRGHGSDLRIEAGGDAPLDAAHVGFGRRDVVLAREQQRDVDRHAGEDRLLDRRDAGAGAGNLDEQIGASARAHAARAAA